MLSAAGVCLLLDTGGPGLPRVRHFGAALGAAGAEDADLAPVLASLAAAPPLLPAQGDGWYGRPGLAGSRDGEHWPVRWSLDRVDADARPGAGGTATIAASDARAGLALVSELGMDAGGLVTLRHTITNTAASPYRLASLECALPVPARAAELLDFTGRWALEKVPQRRAFGHGVWSRESRRGRTGHDATGLLVAGTPGFGFRAGEVWAVHAGWSGDHVHHAERVPEGVALLAAGELPEPGEIVLRQGESYRTPVVYFTWSGDGLDTASARLHEHLRAARPLPVRPVTLNNWEATYFDHGLDRLLELADRAAAAGIERFVLDDGWFRHRRHDRAGLGDWYVDEGVWPGGLHPLAEHVRKHGMQFGLWFEPEMVNPDSDLARAHPDWVLGHAGRLPPPQRNQQTLDLARPEVYAYLLERIDALVTEYELDYIKWDHNRDIAEPVHDGVPGVHAQTLATYRLLDELRARHPALEIESCSSGGARVDHGILARTDRVWTSDSNDALDRQSIQRWTGLLVPPERMGAHVGAPRDHVTGRSLPLAFRAGTALFGHMGVEWDLTSASEAELEELAEWIALHKRLRPVLHAGRVVHADHPDPSALLHGVVTPERAVYGYVQLASRTESAPAPLRLPGLDPAARYEVRVAGPAPAAAAMPGWTAGPVRLPGAVLAELGLPAPALRPASVLVIEVARA
ncbi:alpha-galactosidase [Actinomadura sp. ATCC 31491]|uniref:Alpha-galactosidase n=1 Tax=Actinomadura luzonensis TaxID=2805427 RepID=A0ABT0FWY3_9ACTN|nr:alpha-galactosidase [Actinomadura luzonensis]MCK2216391.1 alpha-galactosidase [Actinomadura luzonensis]